MPVIVARSSETFESPCSDIYRESLFVLAVPLAHRAMLKEKLVPLFLRFCTDELGKVK
jgi:hypothetical protein